MMRKAILLFICIHFLISAYSQTRVNKGEIVFNKPLFKNFAVLMRDTSRNRYNSSFIAPENREKSVELPIIIVDSSLFITCENRLLHPDSLVHLYYYGKHLRKDRKLKKNVKKYIRLYIGYVDIRRGDTSVIVQFVTPKEFRRDEDIFSNQLFLVAGQKRLRFGIIENVDR
ncbi:MAG: hypothetical protein KF862_26370 [Chitinophagaceae bacterium]|nr:hypothetical protein [Chitinophagaceae bacterium]